MKVLSTIAILELVIIILLVIHIDRINRKEPVDVVKLISAISDSKAEYKYHDRRLEIIEQDVMNITNMYSAISGRLNEIEDENTQLKSRRRRWPKK